MILNLSEHAANLRNESEARAELERANEEIMTIADGLDARADEMERRIENDECEVLSLRKRANALRNSILVGKVMLGGGR